MVDFRNFPNAPKNDKIKLRILFKTALQLDITEGGALGSNWDGPLVNSS
jgi:hypothetical protein